MPITTRTITEASCDHCGDPIDTEDQEHVDASVYGAALHEGCWQAIGGPRVARVLGLDDIYTERPGRDRVRAWGPR